MKNKYLFLLLSAIVTTSISIPQAASIKKSLKATPFNPITHRVIEFALSESAPHSSNSYAEFVDKDRSLQGASALSSSPGTILGYTYGDQQHVNTMGRMVGIGYNAAGSDTNVYVHYTWMSGSVSPVPGRRAAYAWTSVGAGAISGEYAVTTGTSIGGYFNLDVTANNQAIISGHYTSNGDTYDFAPTVWYDSSALSANFKYVAQIPGPNNCWGQCVENYYCQVCDYRPMVYPHLAFQTKPDGSHVTHLTGITYGNAGGSVLFYFRKHGNTSDLSRGELSGCPSQSFSTWDCPFIYDTAWATVALVSASKQSGNVALVWTANLPNYTLTPGCDTCSVNSSLGTFRNIYENDVYYQTSNDYGINWNPMQNITHMDTASADWMPYNDIDAMWDNNDDLHIGWVASNWRQYREERNLGFGARIFHWTENYGNDISDVNAATSDVVVNLDDDPILCNAGPNNLNLAKLQLAECNGNLYCLFVDLWDGHDDPNNPDCSYRGYDGDPVGSANGELMVSISDNNGLTWDLPHNVTNSPSPYCDSVAGTVGPCNADHWPSMPPHGFATTNADGSVNGVAILPSPISYPNVPGSEWLPIMYINDQDPGVSHFGDGSIARDNPVKSFYMGCVPPEEIAWGLDCFGLAPDIGWPTFVNPGEELFIKRVLKNLGSGTASIVLTAEEDTGPAGWLLLPDFPGMVNIPPGQTDTVTIQLNASAFPSSLTASVFGRIILEEASSASICTLNVNLIVTDTLYGPDPDTISTGFVSLGLCGHLKFGSACGPGLDYSFTPEGCDSIDSVLYDGSLIVGGIVDGDTILTNQFYRQTPGEETAVYQLTPDPTITTSGIIQYWRSGLLTNYDTTLGMEISYYAPQVTAQYGTQAGKILFADQLFITREFKIWSRDDQPHPDLAVGEVIDWAAPSDTVSYNDIGAFVSLLFVKGFGNYDSLCQDNDTRFAGMSFSYFKKFEAATGRWTIIDTVGYGVFVGNGDASFAGNELYRRMESGQGYSLPPPPHTHPDSLSATEYFTGLTYAFGYDLLPNDTLCFYSVLANVPEDLAGPARIQQLAARGRNFTYYFGCCRGTKGDLNGDGADGNIVDLNFLVNYVFRNGQAPTCLGEADVNSDKSPGDILDLNFTVNRIFRGGAPPATCGVPL